MDNRHRLYSIFDRKSGIWDRPFTAPTHGTGERTFCEMINGGKSLLSQYPEDFALWSVGHFDPQTGQVEGSKPELITEALKLTKNDQHTANDDDRVRRIN